jgi:DNA-binding NarL/FixJ family response regulator
VILERTRETAAIDTLIADAAAGRGAAVLIEADAGMGKTQLLRHAVASAERAGLRVLRATGFPIGGSPFGIGRQLFGPTLTEPDERTERAAAVLGVRGDVPEISEPQVASDALYWLAADLAARQPLLFAVDDAHWADVPSLRGLLHLARRLADHPIALVVAARPAEPGPAAALLAELAGVAAEVLRPGPLTEAAVADLAAEALGTSPDQPVVAACVTATGGNAFLLAELLRSLAGQEPTVAAVEAAAPGGARRRVTAALAMSGGAATALAHALAVLGEAELERVAELAQIRPVVAEETVRALARAALIDLGPPLRFAHPLIASVVAAGMSPRVAAAAHGRAARMLAEAGAPVDAAAGHLLDALPSGDPWTVALLRDAATAASGRGAPEAAVAYLRRALAEPPPAAELAPLLLATGTAEVRVRDFAAAVRTLERGLDAHPDPETLTALGIALSEAHFLHGDYMLAADALEAARLSEADPDRRIVLDANLLSLDLLDPARRFIAERRLRSYRRAEAREGLREPTMLALLSATSMLAARPRTEGLSLLERARTHGFTGAGEQSFTFGWVIGALDGADYADLAQELTDAQLRISRRAGDSATTAYLLSYANRHGYRVGRLAEAEALGRTALELMSGLRHGQSFPFGLIDVLVERGAPDEARELIETFPYGGSPQMTAIIQLMRARAYAATGADERTLELLLAAGATFDRLEILHPQFVPWRALAAEQALALGRRDLAEELAARGLELAHASETPTAIAVGLRTRGEVADDVDDLRASVAVLEGHADALERAKSLAALGARLATGPEARSLLAAALDTALDAGALTVAERAREALLAAGGEPGRPARRGVESLTPAELNIARLAAEGLSEREIAESLFVTVRSVEQHLTSALAKLGVTDPTALAAALAG